MKKRELNSFAISIIVAIFLIISSCDPTKQGAIIKKGACEKSNGNWFLDSEARGQLLVNKSKSKIITFTLKRTEIYTDFGRITIETDTETHKLNPGEEFELFCEKYFDRKDDGRYSMKNEKVWIEYKYEIVGSVIEN